MTRVLSGLFAVSLLASGCWDTITHVYDNNDDCVSDGSTGDHEYPPEGWEGFGLACDEKADCADYPGDRRCLHDVIGLINVPAGYCSACCNEPGPDVCAPGIDCVGDTGIYLVCLMHCNTDEDCRTEDGYECRDIYYVPDDFPGTYCLPTPELSEPDPDNYEELDCPWPW